MAFAVTVELVHHFKWIKGVQSKLKEREDGFRSQHLRWWVQSARVLRHIEVTTMLLNSAKLMILQSHENIWLL